MKIAFLVPHTTPPPAGPTLDAPMPEILNEVATFFAFLYPKILVIKIHDSR